MTETIGKKIKHYRNQRGYTQGTLAEKANISRSYLGDIEGDRYNPSVSTLQDLSRALNIDASLLLGNSLGAETPLKGVKIPVLGKIIAGIPVDAITDILDYEEITPELAKTGDFFALQITGDSMAPKFLENDIVIVKKQSDIDSGDIAIVLVNGDDATVKQVQKKKDGIVLQAYNPAAFEAQFYTNQEIEELPIEILGKVIELRRKI